MASDLDACPAGNGAQVCGQGYRAGRPAAPGAALRWHAGRGAVPQLCSQHIPWRFCDQAFESGRRPGATPRRRCAFLQRWRA